ncbi:MAG TPA: response regulator transcription factor [Caulobacteraceae bacterium]|nr:response regulator transcription factor [Caulobacteraceae bacterium]
MSTYQAPKPVTVLIVSHADSWRDRAAAYLRGSAIEVECAPSEFSAMSLTTKRSFDVLLIDLQLPAESGFSICRRMAGQDGVRVMAVGAGMHEADAVVALELGADDYVSKSTAMRELLARVRAQARRMNGGSGLRFTFAFSGFEWDLRRRQISTPDGSVLTLSSSEISLLVAFIQSGGRELSREELSDLVGRDGMEVSVRAIDSHVSRLRRKFADHGGVHLISTVYGVGYRWAGEERADAAGMAADVAPPRRSVA